MNRIAKILKWFLGENVKNIAYFVEKKQVELLTRGVGGGAILACFMSEEKMLALLVLYFVIWVKRLNNLRRTQ